MKIKILKVENETIPTNEHGNLEIFENSNAFVPIGSCFIEGFFNLHYYCIIVIINLLLYL
jgi:hypothetical protein